MPIQLQVCKGRRVALNWLAHTPFPAIKLHSTLDLESGGVRRIACDTDQDQPFLIRTCTVVDDLRSNEGRMPVEDLLWWGGGVRNRPMEDSGLSHHTDSSLRDPLPEDDIHVVYVRLDLLLGFDIENLQCSASYKGKRVRPDRVQTSNDHTHTSRPGFSGEDA